MTEQLLPQQLESPSGTGRVEPRSDHQPDSPHQQATGSQQADPILTGSSGARVDPRTQSSGTCSKTQSTMPNQLTFWLSNPKRRKGLTWISSTRSK